MKFLSHIPERITPDTKCIIMLHGVGSNEKDLFELRTHFSDDTLILSLQGPFSLGREKYAWYRVDFSTGKPVYQSKDVEMGYSEIRACIDEVMSNYGVSNENIYLMGFSQGAIMSYYTLWKSPEKIGGIIALSGRILDEIDLTRGEQTNYKNKRIFVGHGDFDTVIPYEATRKVEDFARAFGIQIESHSYPIAHTISHEEVDYIANWLNL